MGDSVLVARIRRRCKLGRQQLGKALGVFLRAIHADERLNGLTLPRRPPDCVTHIMGVDHQAWGVVVEIIF